MVLPSPFSTLHTQLLLLHRKRQRELAPLRAGRIDTERAMVRQRDLIRQIKLHIELVGPHPAREHTHIVLGPASIDCTYPYNTQYHPETIHPPFSIHIYRDLSYLCDGGQRIEQHVIYQVKCTVSQIKCHAAKRVQRVALLSYGVAPDGYAPFYKRNLARFIASS